MQSVTRRRFFKDAALYTATAVVMPRAIRTVAAPTPLRIGFISGTDDRERGIRLGIEEAQHAAAMFGGSVQAIPLSPAAPRIPGCAAVIGDEGAHLADICAASSILYMNVASSDDAWRGGRCTAALFHVAPSDAMRRDALAASHSSRGARVVAWDPSLEKFGADTLNQRFAQRFSRPMTADAWCGWFAVKVLWESSLRARSTDAARLREYMTRDTTQFDGHKGRPLSFRAWDRQLRQPVYVIDGPRLTEWPPLGDLPARESLDAIGTTASGSQCRA